MELNRLSQGEKIAAGSAIALFIFMFFKWFGAGGEVDTALGSVGIETSINAWDSFDFIDLILLLTVVAAVGAAVVRATATRINFPLSTVVTLLGALSTLLVLYRIIDPPGSLDRKIGVFLGLIAAALLTYGGYLAMQEEGTSFQDAADRLSGDREADREQRQRDRGGPGAGPPSSPPPPPPPPSSGSPPPSGGPPPPSGSPPPSSGP
jgi:hypothetical protein